MTNAAKLTTGISLALAALSLSLAAAAGQGAPAAGELELEDLGWMAGHWMLQEAGGTTEELWMPARGGMMLGLNRSVQKGRARGSFEYLRIVEDPEHGGVVYLASPGGGPPTPFRLTEVDGKHAVFENPEHDFPKRIEYRLEGEKLTASIAGDTPGPSWSFERVGHVE